MITAVDTNVLIDVLEPDPVYGPASRDFLTRCLSEGSIVACEVVWAEVATAYGDKFDDLLEALSTLGVGYSPITHEAALEAARHWRRHRARGGGRRRIAADFLIGAHALIQCDRLLSRDRGFFRQGFKSLRLLDPAD